MSQYLQDALFELEVRADGADPPKKPDKGRGITKEQDALVFHILPDNLKAMKLPIDCVTDVKMNRENYTLKIITKTGKFLFSRTTTFELTLYIESHLDLIVSLLPKKFSAQFKVKEQPKNQTQAIIRAPKVMKNPLVLIIAVSEYAKPNNNLSGVKSNLAAYRNLFENEYHWDVLPKNGTELNRKAFWTRSDILNFIKKERGRLFDEGDEKDQNERHDGLVVVLCGHGGDGYFVDSEGTHIPLTFLHDMVSFAQDPCFEAVPRIFIVDACRGSKSGKVQCAVYQSQGDDEKQTQDTNAKGQSVCGQRNNLASLYGTVSGFVTWATLSETDFSAAVLTVLKQNARRPKELAALSTLIGQALKDREETQISVLDGDASLNSLMIKPNHKLFPKALSKEIVDVVEWLEKLTGIELQRDSFFESISDGHLLCLTLKAIEPKACSIKYPPQNEDNRIVNIMAFISGCLELGVDERFVIAPEALDSDRNAVDVLCNIYALYVAVAKRDDFKGPHIAQCEEMEGVAATGKKTKYYYIGRIDGATGKAAGYGKVIFENGKTYAGGRHVNGLKAGWGTRAWPDGTCYNGEWKEDKENGYGKYVFANGNVYEGSNREGKEHGYGKFLWTDGRVYEGEWQNGEKSGHGKMIYANGDVYEGAWTHDRPHGKGVYTYGESGNKYEIEYDDEKIIREIMIGCSSGHVSGLKEGHITYLNGDGSIYVGEWKRDLPNGHGKWVHPDGGAYEGGFKAGKPHGYGKYLWPNGDVYEGEWQNGKHNGHGKKMWADGRVYEGGWKDGKWHGKGVFTYANGDVCDVLSDNGKFVRGTTPIPMSG